MTRSNGSGPGGWPERDEELDAMLGALGTPELAKPEASPAEILGRAALLAPAPAGLAGWKLAAVLTVAIGGGFLAGLLVRDGEGEPARAPEALSAALPSALTPVEAPPPPEAPVLESPAPAGSARVSRAPVAVARSSGSSARGGAEAPLGELTAAAPPESLPPEGAVGVACPEPALAHELSQTLQEEDLAAIDEMLPARRAPEAPTPEASAAAERPRREPSPQEEQEPDPVAILEAPARRRLQGSVGAGALILPGAAGGMTGSASLRRFGEEGRGLTLGGQTDVTLISAAPVGRWSLGLGAELGYTFGRGRLRVEPAWTATARLVLPSREPEVEPDPDRPLPPELSSSELALVPMTGAKVGLSWGGEEADRVRLDLGTQASRGLDGGIQPWISLVVGSTFDLGKKGS